MMKRYSPGFFRDSDGEIDYDIPAMQEDPNGQYVSIMGALHDGAMIAEAQVHRWHPKCETCGHWIEGDPDPEGVHRWGTCVIMARAFDTSIGPELHRDPTRFGCLGHTALRGEEEA